MRNMVIRREDKEIMSHVIGSIFYNRYFALRFLDSNCYSLFCNLLMFFFSRENLMMVFVSILFPTRKIENLDAI
jgi:hypothetical protein